MWDIANPYVMTIISSITQIQVISFVNIALSYALIVKTTLQKDAPNVTILHIPFSQY